jgi:hypothetical protein
MHRPHQFVSHPIVDVPSTVRKALQNFESEPHRFRWVRAFGTVGVSFCFVFLRNRHPPPPPCRPSSHRCGAPERGGGWGGWGSRRMDRRFGVRMTNEPAFSPPLPVADRLTRKGDSSSPAVTNNGHSSSRDSLSRASFRGRGYRRRPPGEDAEGRKRGRASIIVPNYLQDLNGPTQNIVRIERIVRRVHTISVSFG